MSTTDKVRVAVGVTGTGVGLGLIGAGEYLKRHPETEARVMARFNEAAKVRMGGTPNEVGRSTSAKLEILARRAKGTPEGEVAARKLTALRSREAKTITGRARAMIKKIRLSAREQLSDVIELGLSNDAAKRTKKLKKLALLRARMPAIAPAAVPGNLPPNQFVVPLSARSRLGEIIELKAVDLGYTYGSAGYGDSPCSSNYATTKHYPTMYISDREDQIDLPLSGTAKVKFKTRSKTSRQDENGKTRHSADIEIQSIDVIEADEAPSKKLKEGAPAKVNTYAARDHLSEIIQLGEGEAVGEGIAKALAKLKRINKPLGAGAVVKRKFYPRQWDNVGKIIKPSTQSLSARLDGIINLADPRPRNNLGEFAGGEEGAPNPNEIDQVYKTRAVTKSIGQNLAGGAVAGVGAAASGSAIKALFSKLKKAKV